MLLNDAFRLIRRAVAIARTPFVGMTGRELMRAYARIELRGVQIRYFQIDAPLRQRLLGYRVTFLSHRSFRSLFEEIFLRHDYAFVADSDSPFIVDCGSNVGMSILYFKKLYPHARIVGFEPFGPAFDALSLNIAENCLENVTVHNLALSNRTARESFYFDPSHVGSLRMSLIEGRVKGTPTEVSTAPLSQYIDRAVDFLKMDIEGAELLVLEELDGAGKLRLIKEMAIEYHHHIRHDQDMLSRLLRILERNDFGYLLRGSFSSPPRKGKFQDLMIRAYRKPA